MRLRKFRVEGFQAFQDSGNMEFSDGFNLIIGQNNSGKSALLRAMRPDLPNDRHRTPDCWQEFRLPVPKAHFVFEASGAEVHDWALRAGGQTYFPLAPDQLNDLEARMIEVFGSTSIVVSGSRTSSEGFVAPYPSHALFEHRQGMPMVCALLRPNNGVLQIARDHRSDDNVSSLFWSAWCQEMFYFTAERLAIGEAPVGYAERLLPNAANLPNVLHNLINERGDVFKKLVDHVCEIFPTVGNLSVRSTPGPNNLEIRVWPTKAMERVELSFPLDSSGTGVSQVIAILTAVNTVENAVVVIDEINSFLHPAAVKSLLRILQTEYYENQYIISTHSPDVVSFSNPKTINLVKRDAYNSTIKELTLTEVSEFREVAEHLGVSMADVFAADRVIWVEGPTEEICFPFLFQAMGGAPLPRGTIITSVAATGDFNRRRDREIVYEVYRRLSSSVATLVVATIFSFDTEELSDADKTGMNEKSGGLLSFLPRRNFECYLLDPIAILNLVVTKDPSSSATVTKESVAAKLSELASDKKLRTNEWTGDLEDVNWLEKVDAAKLIAQTVTELSEGRATFNKKEDSLDLLKDIIARDRQKLLPLYEYVKSLVDGIMAAN